MFQIDKTAFVLIDVQGKLAEIMHERDTLFANLEKLVKGMQALKIPILWMEQIPDKMGPTIQPLKNLLATEQPMAKSSFSCCLDAAFARKLTALGRTQIILAGIETHVCVYQTAVDMIKLGHEVEVVADAVSSRTGVNKAIALDKIKAAGAGITCVETILLELMRTADHPAFRDILKIIK